MSSTYTSKLWQKHIAIEHFTQTQLSPSLKNESSSSSLQCLKLEFDPCPLRAMGIQSASHTEGHLGKKRHSLSTTPAYWYLQDFPVPFSAFCGGLSCHVTPASLMMTRPTPRTKKMQVAPCSFLQGDSAVHDKPSCFHLDYIYRQALLSCIVGFQVSRP